MMIGSAGVPEKTISSKNLFDKTNTIYSGNFVSSSNGTLIANVSYFTSDYIPITAGLAYAVSYKYTLAWYNSNKVFISGSASTDTNKIQIAPAGATYLRASFPNSFGAGYFQVEQSAVNTVYEPYYISRVIDTSYIKDGLLPISSLLKQSVSPEYCNFTIISNNIFDKSKIIDGYTINATGAIAIGTGYCITDYMPVVAGTQYICQDNTVGTHNMRFHCYFDINKIPITGGSNTATALTAAPVGAFYIRATLTSSSVDNYQFLKGNIYTNYEPYKFILDTTKVKLPSTYNGMIWAALGDSITAQGLWFTGINSKFNLTTDNYGVGGTTIAGIGTTCMNNDARINLITIDKYKFITVLGGTNDWAQNIALGTIDSTDVTTFYGALNVLASKMTTRFPITKIYLMTTTYGELYDFASRGWSNAYTNTLLLTTRDYAECIRNVGKKWGISVIDTSANCGWNTINIRSFIQDDGGLLHPLQSGGDRMAEVCIGSIKANESLL